jgi:outer membrane receptor protein involved in Fe transport
MGLVNVGEAATLAPANVSTFTPANTGNSNFFTGAFIADLRGLNPYFGSRTLVLIDGQRAVQTEQGDQFDLNFLPQILVQRIDTVTGGASAAYGSGAIAGVENIILQDKLEGGKLTGDFYETEHRDGQDRHIGAAYGHSLFDGKWHFVIGAEYQKSDAVGCEIARSWCAKNEGAYETGTTPNTNESIIAFSSNIRSAYSSTTGVFLPSSQGYGLGPSSALNVTASGTGTTAYNAVSTPSWADTVVGGDGIPIYQYSNLMAPLDRAVAMGMVTGDLTDYLKIKASYLFGRTKTTDYNGGATSDFIYVTPANAYIQDNPDLVSAAGTYGAYMNKSWAGQVPTSTTFITDVSRATVGLEGKFGNSTWSWDANYEYGETHHSQTVYNNLSLYRMDMALDTVMVNGVAECRVTADGFAGAVAANPFAGYANANPALADGCVPLNPFGTGQLSRASINYAFGSLRELLRYRQDDFTLNTSGNFFGGVGAGPWSLAAGYEWRRERGDNTDQPGQASYLADDYETQYGSSFGGIVTVNEGYLEANLPLLKDGPLAHMLELDVAGRVSQYQNKALYGVDVCTTPGTDGCPANATAPGTVYTHSFPTWKFSGIYEPVDGLRVRASQSRDERAPNFRELYYNQTIGAGGIFGYCDAAYTDRCTWNLLGNPNLKPETADTTTIGVVLTPKDVVPGLQLSADWFHIKVTNAIEQANVTLVEKGCKAGLSVYCSQMEFNDTSYGTNALTGAAAYQAGYYNVTSISPTSYNGAFYEVRGIDFSASYMMDLGASGDLAMRALATWMNEQEFESACVPGVYCPVYNVLGQTGSGNSFLSDYTPDARWRGSLMVTWRKGPVSITPNMTFVSDGVRDYRGVTPANPTLYAEALAGTVDLHPLANNYVPSYFLFGLNGTYAIESVPGVKDLQLFLQVNNLFDKQPPFAVGGGGFGPSNSYGGTNPIFFDTMGRAFRGGFRMSF